MCNKKIIIVLRSVLLVHCAWAWPWPEPVIDEIVFMDQSDTPKDGEEIITPPVLPVLDHLDNDPSTLVPHKQTAAYESADKNLSLRSGNSGVKPRFGFSNAFDISPNTDGGLTASLSNGYSGLGGHSQAASHSVSFGFKQGFQASQSASQSASFNHGFSGASFSGSQASSQSANFNSQGFSSSSAAAAAAASSATLAGGSISASSAQSQSAANSFGQDGGSGSFGQSSSGSIGNSFGGRPSGGFSGSGSSASAQSASVGASGWTPDAPTYGENNLDVRQNRRHRVRDDFVFPGESTSGRFQSSQFQVPTGVRLHGPVERPRQQRPVDWLTSIILSD